MAKIKAGNKTFQSKEKLKNYCKYVLNNQDTTCTLLGEWFDVIDSVLKMHYRYEEKVGEGGYTIGVRACQVNPSNRQFFICRENGTETDFSYYKCLTKTSNVTMVKQSLRYVIQQQMRDYKDKYFACHSDNKGYIICPETQLKINKKSSHLDHYPLQFDEIVSEWFITNKLKVKDITLIPAGDNETAWPIKDKKLIKSFEEFHKTTAKYRLVLDKVNLQRGKAKVVKLV